MTVTAVKDTTKASRSEQFAIAFFRRNKNPTR